MLQARRRGVIRLADTAAMNDVIAKKYNDKTQYIICNIYDQIQKPGNNIIFQQYLTFQFNFY